MITFDGPNKLIILGAGVTSISVKDVWSRWVDWHATSDNSKFLPVFDQIGGQAISASAGSFIPVYMYLVNGWKIRPQEANHTLFVTEGVLLSADGSDPFVDTLGPYTVRINYQQPVQGISMTTSATGNDIATLLNQLQLVKNTVNQMNIPTAQENADALLATPVDPNADKATIGGYITKQLLTVQKFLGIS